MDRSEFIDMIESRIKLVRTEYGFTQEKMAEIIGISKKTLVDIEKGRRSLGWANSVATAIIFKESEIIRQNIGPEVDHFDDIEDLIRDMAFKNVELKGFPTMGGKVWWSQVDERGGYILQQNYISKHYRILDKEGYRVFSGFDLEESLARLSELAGEV